MIPRTFVFRYRPHSTHEGFQTGERASQTDRYGRECDIVRTQYRYKWVEGGRGWRQPRGHYTVTRSRLLKVRAFYVLTLWTVPGHIVVSAGVKSRTLGTKNQGVTRRGRGQPTTKGKEKHISCNLLSAHISHFLCWKTCTFQLSLDGLVKGEKNYLQKT